MKNLISRLWTGVSSTDPAQRKAGGNIIKFLAGLLALTLLARGTSGATLARVNLANPSRGEIVDAVKGNATVSARATTGITAPEGLTIIDIPVGIGQTINAGDMIAGFDMDEISEKLLRETASLDKLMFDLEKLERADITDVVSLDNAQRNLERAREDYSSAKTSAESEINAAKQKLEEALAKQDEEPDSGGIETAKRNLRRAQDDYDSGKARDLADVAAAQEALDEARKKNAQNVDQASVDTAWRNLLRAEQDYNSTKAKADAEVKAAQDSYDAELAKAAPDEDGLVTLQSALNAAKERRTESLLSASRRVEDAQAAYQKAEQDYSNSTAQASNSRQSEIDNAQNALNSTKKKAEDNMQSATRRVEDAEVALTLAEQNYENSARQSENALQTEVSNAKNALETAQKKADDNLQSVARRMQDAEISLAAAQRDYDRNALQTEETATQNSVSLITLRLDIDALKARVDSLKFLASNDGILYSDASGVISAVKNEGSVTGKDALISFISDARGHEANMTLDITAAQRLSVGDECEVTTGGGSMYYTPTVNGVISAISTPDAQDKVRVTILLPEAEWSEGQRVDVQAVRDRGTYDMCIPLSALHSDNSGYYLLMMEQRSTVLGIENIVVRVPVTVESSDSDTAAIRGPVSRNSDIITGSNKAVADGDRVRAG